MRLCDHNKRFTDMIRHQDIDPGKSNVTILWITVGAYHLARIRTLASHFHLTAIEFAASERLHGWAEDKFTDLITLGAGDWEHEGKLKLARRLWKKLSNLRPQVLLVPGYANIPALTGALWGRLHRARTILMSDSTKNDRRRRWPVEAFKRLLLNRLFDAAVVSGQKARDYLCELGMNRKRIFTGYDVVDNDFFAAESGNWREKDFSRLHSPYFLYVGRLAPEKNVDALIRAFDEYRRLGGSWALVIAGDGPLMSQFRAQLASLEYGAAIHLVGRQNTKGLIPFYSAAKCLVLASMSETWGLVVNEAMACGLPVIVSANCGCAPDLVEHNGNGFIFDPRLDSNLTDALLSFERLTDNDRARMAVRSLEIIQGYSLDRWAMSVQFAVEG